MGVSGERATFYITCKADKNDCKLVINNIQKRFRSNILGIYETQPFTNPKAITANVSGNTDFIVEVMGDKRNNVNELKRTFETEMTSRFAGQIRVS